MATESDRKHLQGILFAIAVGTRSLSFEKAAVVWETALQSLIDWGIPEAEMIRACDELDVRIVARTPAPQDARLSEDPSVEELEVLWNRDQ